MTDTTAADSSFDSDMWNHDLAVIGAKVFTMVEHGDRAEAVLIRRGRIVAVGTNDEILSLAEGVDVIDAGGRALVPGFVDSHTHIEWTSIATKLMANFYDPAPATIDDLLTGLREYAATIPSGGWVVADADFRAIAEGRMPTIDELDSVTTDHPLTVFDGVHAQSSNTLGARALGYLTYEQEASARYWSTGGPFSGGTVERDADGRPGPAHDYVMRLPQDLYTVEALTPAIKEIAITRLVAGGVTSASTVCLLNSNEYLVDQALHASGELPLRIRAYYMAPFSSSVDAVLQAGLSRGFGNEMFRIGGFKLIMDSSRPGRAPARHYTVEAFTRLVSRIHARGLQTITHCTSAEGARMVTEAVEEVNHRFADRPSIRHRIEHHRASVELATRIRDAGMFFTMIAPQQSSDLPGAGSGVSNGMGAPYRSYVDKDLRPVLFSDMCGVEKTPRPLFSIAAACNSVESGGSALHGEEADFESALAMWTSWAAESSHQDHDRGSLIEGYFGDLVLLSRDPDDLSPEELFDLDVDATILGGRVVYERS